MVYDYKSKEYLESAFCLIRFSVLSIKTHQNHCLFVNLFYLCNRKSLEKVAELYKAMTENSIIAQNWEPLSSVYIMHSIDDETVPYTNAVRAKSKWRNANITYNFGHYGGHVMTCLRFIYSVRSLLEQEEEERRKYEN